MKLANLLCFVLCLTTVMSQAQTVLRFVPGKPESSTLSTPAIRGKFAQTGSDFSQRIRIDLADQSVYLTLKPSPIKQYTTIYTSSGEKKSTVALLTGSNQGKNYYLTTISNQFHNLLIVENGSFQTIEKTNDSSFIYQPKSPVTTQAAFCTTNTLPSRAGTSSARLHTDLSTNCATFSMGYVCDYAHFIFSDKNIDKIEADNLLHLAAAQEIWTPNTFDATVNFQMIGQYIYTTPDTTPWKTDERQTLFAIWGEFHNTWVKPANWKNYKSLILAGITGINFGATSSDKLTWGVGGGLHNSLNMGSILCKGFLQNNQLNWLIAHELGHVFGASHDNQTGYVMTPEYEYKGSNWSSASKAAINGILTDLENQRVLPECPVISLTAAAGKDSLLLTWTTNYTPDNSDFILDASFDQQRTWTQLAKLNATTSLTNYYKITNRLIPYPVTTFRVIHQLKNPVISNLATVGVLSTQETISTNEAAIYPNPVVNQLTIQTAVPQIFSIYDLTGRLVHATTDAATKRLIDTSTWSSGVYLIKFHSAPYTGYKVVK